MSYRNQRLPEELGRLAAEFISRESGGQSLITVTSVRLVERGRRVDILISVLPEEKEDAALDFLNRQKKNFSEYVSERAKIGRMPSVVFALDKGEKNRQAIEAII